MVKERNDVTIPPAVETFELRCGPLELLRIGCDVRVERNEERVAVPERVRRIPIESRRRAIGWNEIANYCEIISKPFAPQRRIERSGAGDVVIPWCEEIRNAAIGRDSIDQIDKAPIPLACVPA